ncbi:MAG: glycosyltransferase family 2 protein [Smithellaceae bacterium]|nr:glycosyltransferase family 2 protein [Smithellaceae bacterium]
MKTTVIITTYNRPDYLLRTVAGYLNQTRPPDEIIVADDGSTEETAVMVTKITQEATIDILHVWQEDRGFRAAEIRNKAVARSRGQYIILTDDDSIPSPGLVADHLEYAEQGYFIQGHRVLLGPALSPHFTHRDISPGQLLCMGFTGKAQNITNGLTLPWAWVARSRKLRGIRSCNMSFSQADFLAVNGFNHDFRGWGKEDSELAVRFYKFGLKRKDIRFRGGCFHLHHNEFSRENVQRNIGLLEEAMNKEGYFCPNGIDQYLV